MASRCNTEDPCAACRGRTAPIPLVRFGETRLHRCSSCGSWTFLPRPTSHQQAQLHDTDEYFDHPYFRKRRQDTVLHLERCRELFARLEKATGHPTISRQRLLDIGCDTGSFLAAATELFSVEPFGLDVSRRATEVARSRGLLVHCGSIEEAPPEFTDFQLVTAIDIIEHVVDPEAFLRNLYPRMRTGGVLYVQTPNINSLVYGTGRWLCRLTGGWPRPLFERLFPAQHLQYFTPASLAALAERCGFQCLMLGTQKLANRDLEVSFLFRGPLLALQLADTAQKSGILIWAILRKLA